MTQVGVPRAGPLLTALESGTGGWTLCTSPTRMRRVSQQQWGAVQVRLQMAAEAEAGAEAEQGT